MRRRGPRPQPRQSCMRRPRCKTAASAAAAHASATSAAAAAASPPPVDGDPAVLQPMQDHLHFHPQKIPGVLRLLLSTTCKLFTFTFTITCILTQLQATNSTRAAQPVLAVAHLEAASAPTAVISCTHVAVRPARRPPGRPP